MYIVLGATGHVGSAVADALLQGGEAVTVVTRDAAKAARWRARGAEAAVLDLSDRAALVTLLRRGNRAFLLNPPAPPTSDTDAEEHRTLADIVAALDGSGLEKVVLQSTYGAQPGDRIGDLSVLYDFERALARQPIPVTVLRAAYYMSNWDALLPAARDGVLPTMFPPDLALPMVDPADVGRVAARLLREPPGPTRVHHVEGPARYTAQQVADTFAAALAREVRVAVTPRERWEDAYRDLGFSAAGATAYARMTAATVDRGGALPLGDERGTTTLVDHVEALVARGR